MYLNSQVKAHLLHKINYASNTGAQEYDILHILQSRVCRSNVIYVLPKRLTAYVVTVMHGVITCEYFVTLFATKRISSNLSFKFIVGTGNIILFKRNFV